MHIELVERGNAQDRDGNVDSGERAVHIEPVERGNAQDRDSGDSGGKAVEQRLLKREE